MRGFGISQTIGSTVYKERNKHRIVNTLQYVIPVLLGRGALF